MSEILASLVHAVILISLPIAFVIGVVTTRPRLSTTGTVAVCESATDALVYIALAFNFAFCFIFAFALADNEVVANRVSAVWD